MYFEVTIVYIDIKMKKLIALELGNHFQIKRIKNKLRSHLRIVEFLHQNPE